MEAMRTRTRYCAERGGLYGTWSSPRLPAAWSGLDLPREWALRRRVAAARGALWALEVTLLFFFAGWAFSCFLKSHVGTTWAALAVPALTLVGLSLAITSWCRRMEVTYKQWVRELSVRAVPVHATRDSAPPDATCSREDEVARVLEDFADRLSQAGTPSARDEIVREYARLISS